MTLKDRIKELAKQRGISLPVLEADLGFGNSTIVKWDKSTPNAEKLNAVAQYFGVTMDYLLNGISNTTSSKKGIAIKVLGRVAAGIPIDAIEEIIDTEEITEEMAKTGSFFGLKIKGDSMEPRISEGDVVIVRQQNDAESGEIVIATVNGDNATCKRLKKYENGIALLSNNPRYEPMFFTNNEIVEKPVKIIGRVVELRAKF